MKHFPLPNGFKGKSGDDARLFPEKGACALVGGNGSLNPKEDLRLKF